MHLAVSGPNHASSRSRPGGATSWWTGRQLPCSCSCSAVRTCHRGGCPTGAVLAAPVLLRLQGSRGNRPALAAPARPPPTYRSFLGRAPTGEARGAVREAQPRQGMQARRCTNAVGDRQRQRPSQGSQRALRTPLLSLCWWRCLFVVHKAISSARHCGQRHQLGQSHHLQWQERR